jgi:hypothetical protein
MFVVYYMHCTLFAFDVHSYFEIWLIILGLLVTEIQKIKWDEYQQGRRMCAQPFTVIFKKDVVFGSCQTVVTLGFFYFKYWFWCSFHHFWTLLPKGGRNTRLSTNYATVLVYNFVTDGDGRGTSYKPSTFTSLNFTTRETTVLNSMSFDE